MTKNKKNKNEKMINYEILERRFLKEPHCRQHTAYKIKLTNGLIIERVCTQCGFEIKDKTKW
ncbi:MAG: hypothetical protein WC755_08425 [Candidatus Woesearchaeota archaeon]|jgi:hypothetical protein